MITTLILIVMSSLGFAQGQGYSGIEIYPAGDFFYYSGKDVGENFKVDLWATNDFEIAFTTGPKIGPFATGVGFSMGNVDAVSGIDLMYLNADLGFGFDFGNIHWQSYDLYQYGQGLQGDFVLLRQWISHKRSNFGVIGHNIKIGDNPFNFHWGSYYNFGQIANSSANKFCIAIDLANDHSLWATWVVEF